MTSRQVRIAIDAMGGDNAPHEIIEGAVKASQELDVEIILVGDTQQIQTYLKENHPSHTDIEIVDAIAVVDMHEKPLRALRRKPKASINVATNLVKQGLADGVVSAGHSGAAMAAGFLHLGRMKGIDRPAIGTVFPTVRSDKSVIILDVGANVDCRPKYLEQYAVMGSIYSKYVLEVKTPQVGLLNMGEEPNKGNDLAIKTHKLLEKNPHISFKGNAEGRDVLSGDFDVIVCDGFIGNILLKFAEAMAEVIIQIFKEELPKGINGKIGSALLKSNFKNIKRRIDHAEHGGALLFWYSRSLYN